MNIEKIGVNAGIVWRTLYSSDADMSIKNLIDATGLDVIQVAAAVGWLARENKIIVKETDSSFLLNVYRECYY